MMLNVVDGGDGRDTGCLSGYVVVLRGGKRML